MKRGYTVEDYRAMYDRIRALVPDYAVTSDFIVGFSGETDADFAKTVALVEECRFKNSFIFKYSERPGTKGADLYPDDVPEEVKRERNNVLLAIQNRISEEDNQAFVGRTVEVLVEGLSKDAQKYAHLDSSLVQLVGRTHCDRIVVFEGNRRQAGQLIRVFIDSANAHTLFGQVVTRHVGPEVYQLSLPGG
jgi:tRNA-2-methylthio-N6-dimethylallyladenosine synthase